MTTQCFGVNGTADAEGRYIPCNTTAVENGGHTGCCAPGDNCLTNGLCQGQGDASRKANLFWRNGCTDPTWEDAACARHCVGLGQPDTQGVFYCLSADSWCCSAGSFDSAPVINTTCCSVSKLEFNATDPVVYTIAELNFVSTSTASRTGASSATVQSRTTATDSSITSTAQPSHTSSSASSSPSSSSGSNSNIGVDVGVPLGIILAIALGVIAWLLYKKQKASQSAPRSELAANGAPRSEKRRWMFKTDAGKPPLEMPDSQVRAELPAGK